MPKDTADHYVGITIQSLKETELSIRTKGMQLYIGPSEVRATSGANLGRPLF